MLIRKTYKVELDPNNKQITVFLRHAGAVRYVYNWGLSQRIKKYQEEGKSLSYFDQTKALTGLKQEYIWLYDVAAWPLIASLKNLDEAFKSFFRRVKIKNIEKPGFPKFKSRSRKIGSFRFSNSGIKIESLRIKLPRIGWIRIKEHNYILIDANVKNVTISEHVGKWFAAVQTEIEIEDKKPEGESIGIDLGIKSLATCSNGQIFENPKALYKAEKKLIRLQRKLSRRKKGGKNREKAKREVGKLHYCIHNIRKDAIHKATTMIINQEPSIIVIENLNVSGMLKNNKLSKAIADTGFYEFRRQIEYKAKWSGIKVQVADRWYASSKICSFCGYVKKELKLSERIYVCEKCGLKIDRDINAAINLRKLSTTGALSESNACGDGRFIDPEKSE